jgi:hypothetical protein
MSPAQRSVQATAAAASTGGALTQQAGTAQEAQDIQQVFGAMTLRETFTGELSPSLHSSDQAEGVELTRI